MFPFGMELFRKKTGRRQSRGNAITAADERGVPAGMRDGTVLRADIYRPNDSGKFPVFLERTPYNKLDGDGVFTPEFSWYGASRGYVVIVQDCRGRFRSEGDWYPLKYEAEDGCDTIEWVANMAHSHGRVGMLGDSYFALTAILAATSRPPHLAGTFVVFPAAGYGDGFGYRGGAFLQELIESWTSRLALNTLDRREQQDFPLSRWQMKLPLYAEAINLPIFQVEGWYDSFLGGTLNSHRAIKARGGVLPRKTQKLLIGPWYHGPLTGKTGDIEFGTSSHGDMEKLAIRRFDHILKGIKNGIDSEKPIVVFVMGKNVWRDEDEWPLANARLTSFYFHSAGKANSLTGGGLLSQVRPEREEPDCFVYDPADPVPTIGSATGVVDQRAVEARADVSVYTSLSLKKALEATGPVIAEIYASSSAVDTDLSAKPVDVWPNGYAQSITDGILRTCHRNTYEEIEFIKPSQICRLRNDLWATSNVFLPGHLLRMEISSSNFPRFNRNLNTGRAMVRATSRVKATNVIYHDRDHASTLILPLVSEDRNAIWEEGFRYSST